MSILKSDFKKFLWAAIVSLLMIFVGFYFMSEIFGPEVLFETKIINNDEEVGVLEPSVEIMVLEQGEGRQTEAGDVLTVHYIGTLVDGTQFDSSLDRGEPFVFTLGVGKVIRGWDKGLLGMRIGEKRRLTVPPELGYGVDGVPELIPPNATLIFEVELLEIE